MWAPPPLCALWPEKLKARHRAPERHLIADRESSKRRVSAGRFLARLVREAPRLGAEAAPPDGFALKPAANGQSRWIEAGRQSRQRERGQHEAEVS